MPLSMLFALRSLTTALALSRSRATKTPTVDEWNGGHEPVIHVGASRFPPRSYHLHTVPHPRTIVITGASAGIGAALARHLGAAGHRLVLAARSRDKLDAVTRESGRNARAVVTDVTKRADVERLRDEALRAFGHVDVWINNAGQGIDRHVLDLTDDDVDEMMAVNVKSALYGIQAIVPHFIERGAGHLINISSFLGRVPLATNRSAYNAAKAALNALTANLRVDLSREHPGIHVSLVMPSVVTTDFAVNALGSRGPARMVGPMQPQTPDEVAAIIAALIEAPKAEILTNPAAPAIAKRYLEDVGGFEAEARRGRMAG